MSPAEEELRSCMLELLELMVDQVTIPREEWLERVATLRARLRALGG